MKSFIQKLISILGLIIPLISAVAFGQSNGTVNMPPSGPAGIYFVPDVIDQFNKLALRPEPLAFGLRNAPDPHVGKHFQGIVRRTGPGTTYMYLSRSGNDTLECVFCDNDPGNIYIVKMESRETTGERLRSNRLLRGSSMMPGINPNQTPPDIGDRTVRTIHFNGQDDWPNYGHPGGLQMIGDVLVVPLTHRYNPSNPENLILFLDVSDPEAPVFKSQFDPLQISSPSSRFEAGQVAIAPVQNPDGPGVRYIMLLGNDDVRLFRSLPTCSDGSTDLKDENLSWEFIGSWNPDNVTDTSDSDWPHDGTQSFQMYNFVRQGDMNGPLFLISAFNDEPVLSPGSGNDYLFLFQVNVDKFGNPDDHLVTKIERKHVSTDSIYGGGDTSHFTGSTGTYVSPTGELIIYASEHANYGPAELLPGGERGRETVRFGEWRHREMVRPDSPTLKPWVDARGPFEIDEGSADVLLAFGRAPITKAWMQFFEDDGMGLSDNFDGNDWLVADYDDWSKDDYDDFQQMMWFFNDNAGSWRWFAPVGGTIRVYEHAFDDSNFPGRAKTLVGTGLVENATDLDAVRDDNDEGSMDDMISSMQFFCSAYYTAPIKVLWDFDRDGNFEGSGNLQNFSAAELDGPSLVSVPIRAQHPTDTTPLGHSPVSTFDIRIRNVAPSVATFDLVDPLGFKVGTDLPFAMANLKYAAEGSFTDPGKPDHQTAKLDFGDGTILLSSAFDSFSDAFGGATGQFSQRHRFSVPGTYTIGLEVTDDDGGVTSATKSVTVVTPAQVIQGVVSEIDQRLATATNRTVIRALRDARDYLAGHNNGSAHDGALDALASGDLVSALEKIGAAIEALQRAKAAGAGDLRQLKYLLGFIGESVAQGAYQDAVDAIGTPSPGQATQLETIRQSITDGHAQLVNKQYLSAIDLFKDATSRALSLP
jgi:hypothetical protein